VQGAVVCADAAGAPVLSVFGGQVTRLLHRR
jgi:hypothetical protein